MTDIAESRSPVLRVRGAGLGFGSRTLWKDLDLDIAPGEFLAVLGPNGSGKTSFLKTVLGEQPLDRGTIELDGRPVRRGDRSIGYIPQQKLIPAGTPLRGRDLVGLGVDGHRFGFPIRRRAERERVERLIDAVEARRYANDPVGSLSGGEQQRLRVAQSLADDPVLLLCDEPLASLDLQHQRGISELIDLQRRDHGAAVVFVTHDINPILGMVDRVLYLAGGQFRTGSPGEVLRSDVLSSMYGTDVEVIRSSGRIIVAGVPDTAHHEHEVVTA